MIHNKTKPNDTDLIAIITKFGHTKYTNANQTNEIMSNRTKFLEVIKMSLI